MSFVTFMGSHWPTLAFSVAAAALSAFVLLVSGASAGLSLLVAGVVVGAGLLSIAIDYRRNRPFNRLRATLEKIGITGYLTTHRGRGYSV